MGKRRKSKMKKMTTMYVSLVACLMFAGVATADPVKYRLSVDGDVIGGTITFDTDVAPSSSNGTTDTYTYGVGDGAITAFSFYRSGSTASFDQTDDVWDFILTMATADDTPESLMMDVDDSDGDYIFADPGFDFGTGLGQYEPGDVTVTNAALNLDSLGLVADAPASYRIAFVTSSTRDASSAVIGDYNAFVTTAAGNVTLTIPSGTTWNCIGSTATVSARVNTGTTLTDGGATDVPIYTTTGLRIATGNADLWDGHIENPISFDNGTPIALNTGGDSTHETWTGTNIDGSSRGDTEDGTTFGNYDPLVPGNSIYVCAVQGGYTDGGWIEGAFDYGAESKYFLALSSVIGRAIPGTVILFK
jgi:hypothetical protein